MCTCHREETNHSNPLYRNGYLEKSPERWFCSAQFSSQQTVSIAVRSQEPLYRAPARKWSSRPSRPFPRAMPAPSWSIYWLGRCYLETVSCAFSPGAFAFQKGTLQTLWTDLYVGGRRGIYKNKLHLKWLAGSLKFLQEIPRSWKAFR